MKNETYDLLKYIAQIVLPAIGLYICISQYLGLPYGEQIVGTITAIDACLGTLLMISTQKYNNQEK